jgi:hypothetical protein
MPVTYHLDRARGCVETVCTGPVTLGEVLQHFREIEADDSLPGRLDVLLDLGPMTSLPESEQLRDVTRAVDRLRAKVAWGACAIVARRDALFGMSRMFEIFTEGLFARTRVFREREAAEDWLASGSSGT